MLLKRFAYLPSATLGELFLNNGASLYTIERPWLNNQSFISCIPCGTYELEWDVTGRIKNVPRLRDTMPRTQINIHVANYARELHGCIAPGLDWKFISDKEVMVLQSRAAMGLILETLDIPMGVVSSDGIPLNESIEIINVDAKA